MLDANAIDEILAEFETKLAAGDGYRSYRLSDWEEDFVISVIDQWQQKRSLSEKQAEILERIWQAQP